MIVKIVALTIVLGGGLELLSKKVKWLESLSLWVRLAGAAAASILCIVAFWQPEVEPLTQNAFEEISNNQQTELMCRFDSLEARLKSPAGLEEPDSTFRAQTRVLSECLDSIARTALEKGMVAFGLEKYDEALTHLGYALTAVHENLSQRADVFFYMGQVHHHQREYTLVLNCLDSSAAYNPESYLVWNNRGYALDELGRYVESIASYDSALFYKPDDHPAWMNRGISLRKLGRYVEAVTSYDIALGYKPDFHDAWYNRGMALAKLGRYEEAIASYDSALTYKQDKHEAWNNRGNALYSLGRFEEAIASFESALIYKPDYQDAWYNRGMALAKLSRYVKAIASYDSALVYNPSDHEAWNNRGNALDKFGRYDEAIASFDSALSYKPDKYVAWYNRAISLAHFNRFEDALGSCDSALKYAPFDTMTVGLRQLIMKAINE